MSDAFFKDTSTTLEYQLSTCNPTTFTDDYFFMNGFTADQDLDDFFDTFERLGTIYISRNKQQIIIKDNYFSKNIGTFGGAITINSPDWALGESPYVLIYNNEFERNMAYFSGNAIYIRNTVKDNELDKVCAGVNLKYNTFTNNVGMKFHNGGAVSIHCEYLSNTVHQDYIATSGYYKYMNASNRTDLPTTTITTVLDSTKIKIYRFKVAIESNDFTQNMAGIKGSALYISQISDILIYNCTFLLNGPVTSISEQYYSPYVAFLSPHPITFYDTDCFDEYEYLEKCNDVSNSYIDFPRVKGAVHVIFCQLSYCLNSTFLQNLEISNSDFLKNEAGPILEERYDNTEATSSNIHIVGGFSNLISECNFWDNKGSTFYYTNMKTSNLTDFFPDGVNYFQSSMSSIINVYLNPTNPQDFVYLNTTIQYSKFYRNKNTQVAGLTDLQQYNGQILKVVNYASSATSYLPIINIYECEFKDNIFIGEQSSLIYSYNAILRIIQSTFLNNGYISETTFTKSFDDITIDSSEFPFSDYTFEKSQYYGMVFVEGTTEMPLNKTHEFYNNSFSFIFSQYGTAYALNLNSQQALIFGNTYKYLFASQQGSLLYGYSSTARALIFMQYETINYLFGNTKGAIVIEPTKQNLMSLFVRNTVMDNTQAQYGSAFYLLQAAKVTLTNITLTRTTWLQDNAAFIKSKFTQQYLSFSSFADNTLFKYLLNSVTRNYGYIYLKDVLNTDAVTFAGITQTASTYKYIKYVEILNSRIMNGYSVESNILDSTSSYVRVANDYGTSDYNILKNNTGVEVGSFGLYYGTVFIGENLKFYNNTSQNKANSMILSQSDAYITNATFLENESLFLGAILIESNSNFECYYCNFIKNKAYDTSTIFAYNNLKTNVIVKYAKFLNNTSTSNLISYLYSSGNINNSTFLDNISDKVNNGLTLVNSKVQLSYIIVNFTNETFLYNNTYLVDTGFFNLNYQSELTIEYSTLLNCRGAIGALIYATGSSLVYIKSNTLIQNIQSQTGSVVYATMAKGVYIDSSYFKDNSQVDVYLDITEGQITNSQFYKGTQQFIYATSAYVTLYNNLFYDGSNTNTYGKALYCNCYFMNITNNIFRNLTAVAGGALYFYSVTTTSNFTIKGNNFINNTAQQGGAIYIQDSAQLDLIGNYYYGNKAIVIYPKTLESSKLSDKGLGGAIYYACSNDDIQENGGCIVNFKTKNNFLSNYAEDDGGAIIYVSNSYNEDGTSIFRNNTAYYGNDVASYPNEIYVEILSNGDYYDPYTTNDTLLANTSRRMLQSLSYMPTFVSGTSFQFNVYILDQNGNIYKTDSISKCTFKYTGSSRVIVTGNEVIANQGVYYFTEVEISAVPGSELNFKLEITGLETYNNEVGFMESAVNFNMSLRDCIKGEQYTSDNRCDKCAAGTYLYDPPSSETACKECPSAAICYGSYIVAPKTSYWRSSNISDNFIYCPNPDACLAGNETNPTGICADGYKGILCGDCDDDYSKTAQFECSGCPERVRNIVQITFMMIAAVFYVAFVVRSTLTSSDKEKPVYSVYVKIMTNHFQVLSAISNIDYNWPEQIQEFSDNQNSVSSVSDQIFSFDCFLMSGGKDNGPIPVYYQKLVMYGLAPLIMAGGDILFWFILGTIKGRNYGDLRSKFTSTLVVLLFLVHPNIVKAMFLSFNCLSVDEVFRLKENISSVCYQGEHLSYIMIISMPSVVVWAIGIPLFAFILLRANRFTLILQDKKVVTESENQRLKVVKMKYGFIFIGYRGVTYFWEVILMYRKVGIIMSTVFLSTLSNESQVLAVMLIIIGSMLLHIKHEPYNTKILNQMELYSLFVAAITLYAGMYYVTGSHYSYMDNEGLSWFFLIFIISPNAVFFVYFGYYMRLEILKMLHQKNKPKIFRIIACTSQENFYEKYMKNDNTRLGLQTVIPDDQAPQDNQVEEPQQENEDKTKGDGVDGVDELVNTEDINLEFHKLKNAGKRRKRFKSNHTEDVLVTQRALKQMSKEAKVHPFHLRSISNVTEDAALNQNESHISEKQGLEEESKIIEESPKPRIKKGYSQQIFDRIRNLKKRKLAQYQEKNEVDINDVKISPKHSPSRKSPKSPKKQKQIDHTKKTPIKIKPQEKGTPNAKDIQSTTRELLQIQVQNDVSFDSNTSERKQDSIIS